MPIQGVFISGQPYVACKVILPRLYLVNEVLFLVDTGADGTVVMPTDGSKLGADYSQLRGDILSIGVGGSVHSYHEPALLVLPIRGMSSTRISSISDLWKTISFRADCLRY